MATAEIESQPGGQPTALLAQPEAEGVLPPPDPQPAEVWIRLPQPNMAPHRYEDFGDLV